MKKGRSDPADLVTTNEVALPDAGLCCMVSMGGHGFSVQLPAFGRVVIGRGSDADLRVMTEGVSRTHAVLELSRLTATVSDLGSRNGTLLNGERITGTQKVAHGDEIRLGDAQIVLMQRIAGAARGMPIVLLHAAFLARLRLELERARGLGRSLAVVRVELPDRWYVLDALRSLLARLRPADVCGARDDRVLELALPDTSAAEANTIATALADELRASGIHAGVGFSIATERDVPVEQLVAEAEHDFAVPSQPSYPPRDSGPVVVDPKMRALFEQVARFAPAAISVLVIGETGVGKDVVARALHDASGRRGKLVAVNVAALPESLIESELFGYERGAFSGAQHHKPGLFEAAEQGTLFLDEIGELPLAMQAKLLRVLEERTLRRVGATSETSIDVRFVAATNVDLERSVEDGRFRRDLYFRLNGVSLVVPPLRERSTEILALAQYFLARAAVARRVPEISSEARDLLVAHAWPGNVRELKNVMERAVALLEPGRTTIEPEHLPPALRRPTEQGSVVASAPDVRDTLAAIERQRITDALERCGGNRTQAAELLGLPRKTLAYRMERLGIGAPKR